MAREFRPAAWRSLLRWFLLPVPAYQAALVVLALLVTWVWAAGRAPSDDGAPPATAPRERTHVTTPLECGKPSPVPAYDASRIIGLDPNIF